MRSDALEVDIAAESGVLVLLLLVLLRGPDLQQRLHQRPLLREREQRQRHQQRPRHLQEQRLGTLRERRPRSLRERRPMLLLLLLLVLLLQNKFC